MQQSNEQEKRTKTRRTEEFDIHFEDGLVKNWAFDVPTCFRDSLDIKYLRYVDKDNKETRFKMAWTRGVPPLLSFSIGDVFYEPAGLRQMRWEDALKIIKRAVKIKSAIPITEDNLSAGGRVEFEIIYYKYGTIANNEILELSQNDFENFLKTGNIYHKEINKPNKELQMELSI